MKRTLSSDSCRGLLDCNAVYCVLGLSTFRKTNFMTVKVTTWQWTLQWKSYVSY